MVHAEQTSERWAASEARVRRYAATGERSDLEAAFAAFQPLARALASRYRRTSVPRDDLEQAAYLGLLKALHRFDPDRGCPFTAFAVPTVLGEIRRQCREAIWPAHVPRPVRERVQRLRAAADDLRSDLGRPPTTAELARRLGWDHEAVLEARLAVGTLASVPLEAGSGDEDTGASVADTIGQEDDGFELAECRADIERALPRLDEDERRVLRMRFADERTLAQIGAELQVAPGQAARLLRRSLERLASLSGAPGARVAA